MPLCAATNSAQASRLSAPCPTSSRCVRTGGGLAARRTSSAVGHQRREGSDGTTAVTVRCGCLLRKHLLGRRDVRSAASTRRPIRGRPPAQDPRKQKGIDADQPHRVAYRGWYARSSQRIRLAATVRGARSPGTLVQRSAILRSPTGPDDSSPRSAPRAATRPRCRASQIPRTVASRPPTLGSAACHSDGTREARPSSRR